MRIIVELVNTMFKKRQKKIDQSRRTENVHRRVKSAHFYPTHDFLCTPLTLTFVREQQLVTPVSTATYLVSRLNKVILKYSPRYKEGSSC